MNIGNWCDQKSVLVETGQIDEKHECGYCGKQTYASGLFENDKYEAICQSCQWWSDDSNLIEEEDLL